MGGDAKSEKSGDEAMDVGVFFLVLGVFWFFFWAFFGGGSFWKGLGF